MRIRKSSLLFIFIAALAASACSKKVYTSKPLPPGQAKKITGSKSAKHYAPGQQKKKKYK